MQAAVAYARFMLQRKERRAAPDWVECGACFKWRRLPAGERVGRGHWECRLHPHAARYMENYMKEHHLWSSRAREVLKRHTA